MAWRHWRGSGRAPVRVREGLRLSPNEERYILAETHTGQVYAAPSATRIKGRDIDPAAALAAFQATCDNHEARRTGFEMGPDGKFTKYVEDRATVHLEQRTMLGASDEALIAAVNAHCLRKGDLSPGELHRFILITVGPQEYVFGMALHHATSDAMTQRAFGLEVLARTLGMPVPAASSQYSDFWDFDWQASEAYRNAEAFWLERAASVGEVAAWPPDRIGADAVEVRPGEAVVLSPATLARTREAAAEIGVTHFSFFYAAYLVLLARLTGSSSVCTTFQSAGRRAFQGADGAHGVFSNALMLATQVDETESIADLATRVRAEVKTAISHEIYPLHHLIRATGLHPRYAINWMPESQPVTLDGTEFTQLPFEQNQDDDDLNLRFITRGSEVKLVIYYNPAAFSAERVGAATRHLVALADELARDIRRPIGEIRSADLAPPGLLPDLTEPLPEGGERRIFDAFLARAAARPDAIAVSAGEDSLTYAALEERSRELAGALHEAGIEAGDPVAILAERTPGLVVTMLAAARLGTPFVILDAAYPEPRLAALLATCVPRAIVWSGAPTLNGVADRLAAESGSRVLPAEAGGPRAPADRLDSARPGDLAYMLFTSGSTGTPKCVACSHEPLVHFVDWQAREFALAETDRFTLLSGLSHDPLLRDVFTPLSIGATIVVPDAGATSDPAVLARWIARSGATVTHLTPQLGRLLAAGAARTRRLSGLRRIFWGGDLLPPDLVRAYGGLAPRAEQTNFYGATETPQAAGFQRLGVPPVDQAATPVGRGIDGVQLVVVDDRRRPLGVGELGEIAVRSNRLPLGYVEAGRPVAPDDRATDPAGRTNIHCTGDQGLFLPDGSILLVGRRDDQLKVRGHRVHLSEVVAALRARPGVRDAAALATGAGADLAIVGFVTGHRVAGREADVQAALAARLPAHMVPQQVVWLDELPRSPNGKLDRAALRAHVRPAAAQVLGEGNAVERELMQRWSQILGGVAVTRESTFGSLGGDSLSYVQGFIATEEVIGEAPTDWRLMTVAELAATRRPARTGWSTVDTPLVMRALAILMVVVGHFQVGAGGAGGATSALFLVSGFMFGGLSLKEVFARRSAAPVMRVVGAIFLPTALLSALIWLARSPGQPPSPEILFFTADLTPPRPGRNQETYLWFVHSLLHMMAMIWLAVLALKALGRFDIGPRRFLFGFFAVACLLRFGVPPLVDPAFYALGHRHDKLLDFLPTSNLAIVLLGALAATATTRSERLRLLPILLAFSALTAFGYGVDHAIVILAACLLLLVAPRVPVPRLASPIVLGLAGASLWIYLSHMLLRDAVGRFDTTPPLALSVGASLAGGVALWMVWMRGSDAVRRLLRKPAAPADAVV